MDTAWFLPPETLSVGLGASDMRWPISRRTGWLDIVVTNRLSGEVEVFQNLGSGDVRRPVIEQAGAGPYGVTGSAGFAAVTSLEGTTSATSGVFTPGGLPSLVALNPGSNTFGLLSGLGRRSPVERGDLPDTGRPAGDPRRRLQRRRSERTRHPHLRRALHRAQQWPGRLPPADGDRRRVRAEWPDGRGPQWRRKGRPARQQPSRRHPRAPGQRRRDLPDAPERRPASLTGGRGPQRDHPVRVHLRRSAHRSGHRPDRRRRHDRAGGYIHRTRLPGRGEAGRSQR